MEIKTYVFAQVNLPFKLLIKKRNFFKFTASVDTIFIRYTLKCSLF